MTLKDASTVMLLRDGPSGIEVFLQRRVKGMAFAGGMTVFPGGGVDPSDADSALRWAGPPVSWWAQRFGVDESKAQALVCAAVRETFEECGVLLAGPSPDDIVADSAGFRSYRRALERRELSMREFLQETDLVLRADLLRPWANWITPVGEQRRYDTRFFVAVVPVGQHPDDETSEAELARWEAPADALAEFAAGASMLLPPTWVQLTALSGFAGTAQVLAAVPEITPIEPKIVADDGNWRVEFAEQDAYYAAGVHPWQP